MILVEVLDSFYYIKLDKNINDCYYGIILEGIINRIIYNNILFKF